MYHAFAELIVASGVAVSLNAVVGVVVLFACATPPKQRTSSKRWWRRLTHVGVGDEEDRRERLQICQVPHANLVVDKEDTSEDAGGIQHSSTNIPQRVMNKTPLVTSWQWY